MSKSDGGRKLNPQFKMINFLLIIWKAFSVNQPFLFPIQCLLISRSSALMSFSHVISKHFRTDYWGSCSCCRCGSVSKSQPAITDSPERPYISLARAGLHFKFALPCSLIFLISTLVWNPGKSTNWTFFSLKYMHEKLFNLQRIIIPVTIHDCSDS